jgi:hypothetical protein
MMIYITSYQLCWQIIASCHIPANDCLLEGEQKMLSSPSKAVSDLKLTDILDLLMKNRNVSPFSQSLSENNTP